MHREREREREREKERENAYEIAMNERENMRRQLLFLVKYLCVISNQRYKFIEYY